MVPSCTLKCQSAVQDQCWAETGDAEVGDVARKHDGERGSFRSVARSGVDDDPQCMDDCVQTLVWIFVMSAFTWIEGMS